jgi:hypothetical protein
MIGKKTLKSSFLAEFLTIVDSLFIPITCAEYLGGCPAKGRR